MILSSVWSPHLPLSNLLAIHTRPCAQTWRNNFEWRGGRGCFLFHRRFTTGISSECLNAFFNYELLLKSQYKKMMPIKFFINNWKGYICTFKTFIQRDTNLWFVSSEAPKVQLKDIQSVYCEFRQPAPKTIPMLKLYSFSREKKWWKPALVAMN